MGVFFSHPKKNRTFGSFIPYSLRISGQIAELVQSLFLGNIMSPHETVDVLSNLLVQVATASMFARQLFGYVFLQRTYESSRMWLLSSRRNNNMDSSTYISMHIPQDYNASIVHVTSTACSSETRTLLLTRTTVCKCKKHQLRSTEMRASARNISCAVPRCLQVQETSVA